MELSELIWPLSDLPAMQALVELMQGYVPRLKEPQKWSADFVSFVNECLEPDPVKRKRAAELLRVRGTDLMEKELQLIARSIRSWRHGSRLHHRAHLQCLNPKRSSRRSRWRSRLRDEWKRPTRRLHSLLRRTTTTTSSHHRRTTPTTPVPLPPAPPPLLRCRSCQASLLPLLRELQREEPRAAP